MTSHFELEPAAYAASRAGHLQRRRAEIVAGVLASETRGGDVVVDIGCGPGQVVAELAEKRNDLRFVGLDVAPAMIEHARRAYGAPHVAFRDMSDAGLASGSVRVAYCIDVLHHLADVRELLRWLGDVLAPRGVFVAIEPNMRNPYVWVHQERMKRRGLDEEHFRQRAFEVGVALTPELSIEGRRTAFVIPGAIQHPPRFVQRLERRLEGISVLGGSVVYRLRKRS